MSEPLAGGTSHSNKLADKCRRYSGEAIGSRSVVRGRS